MEKYRKFDDPSCGLNPFTPIVPNKKLEGWKYYVRLIVAYFLMILRTPCIMLGIWVGMTLHCMKYILIHPAIIRWCECQIDSMYTKLILSTSSYN
jgi:hypothetical protein